MDELLCNYKRRLSAIGQMITSCEDKTQVGYIKQGKRWME